MNFFINLCNVIDGCCVDLHYMCISLVLQCMRNIFFLSFEQFDMLLGRLEKDGSRKVKICALLCNCCFTFCPSPALLTCICLPVFCFTFSFCHSLTQSVRQTQKPSFHTPPACSVIVWMSRIKKKKKSMLQPLPSKLLVTWGLPLSVQCWCVTGYSIS